MIASKSGFSKLRVGKRKKLFILYIQSNKNCILIFNSIIGNNFGINQEYKSNTISQHSITKMN